MPLRSSAERLARQLPLPLKAAAKRAAAPADVAYRLAHRRRHGETRPIPPVLLRSRVGSGTSIAVFLGTGHGTVRALESALRDHGASFATAERVLDFGCGCGRVITALLPPAGPASAATEVHGCDVDAEAIGWCRRHLPQATFAVNGFAPPLPYADESFDVLCSSSILTHLPEDKQDAWLAEIRRVLRPGGMALVTVAGRQMFDATRSGEVPSNSRDFSQRLRRLPDLVEAGFVFEPYVRAAWNARDFPGIDDEYGVAYHSAAYVQEHWGRWFDVLELREGVTNYRQDLVVLRRS